MDTVDVQWITDYLECTEGTYVPAPFRYWSGVACLSAALGRKISVRVSPGQDIEYGWKIHPNMYIILVSESGSAKSDAIRQGGRLIRESGLTITPDMVSPPKLYKFISDEYDKATGHSEATIVQGELSTFLCGAGTNKSAASPGLIQALIKLYDLEEEVDYQTAHGVNAMCQRPYVTMLTGTTPGDFHTMLPVSTHGKGFLSRALIVYYRKAVKRGPDSSMDHRLRKSLLTRLMRLREKRGVIEFLPEATEAYLSWLDRYYEQNEHIRDEYESRMAGHVCRLAAIHAAADIKMRVTAEHFEMAAERIRVLVPDMRMVMRMTTGNPMSPMQEDLLQKLRATGPMSEEAFYRNYRNYGTLKQLEQALALLRKGKLVSFQDKHIVYVKEETP